jgi:prenyltransferase beta subunit
MIKLRRDPMPYLMAYASPVSKLKVFAALGEVKLAYSLNILEKVKTYQKVNGGWGEPGTVNGTAYTLYFLLELGESKNSAFVTNAVKWLLSKQLDDGGWTETIPPPKYIKNVIKTDQSCTWITAHVVQALVKADAVDSHVELAVKYLKTCQNADGGWPPWKGGESMLSIMDYILKALVDYGEPIDSPCLQNAIKYILSKRPQWTPFDVSSVLPCLLIVGFKPTAREIKNCLAILVRAQNEDGGWTYPGKSDESDPGLTAHIVYWLTKCGYRFKLPTL